MRVLSLAEVAKMGEGETVPAVRAKIKSLFKPREGTGGNGNPYKFQDITLIDGKVEFKATLNNHDFTIPNDWKGKSVILTCHEGQHGMTGLKIKDTSYTKNEGKADEERIEQIVLWVTKTAEVALEGATPGAGTTPPPGDQRREEKPPAQRQQTPPPADTPPANGPIDFRPAQKILLPILNLYYMVTNGLDYVDKCRVASGKEPLDPENRRAATHTLFIEACKQGALQDVPQGNMVPHLKPPETAEQREERLAAEALAAAEQAEAAAKEAARIAEEAAKKAKGHKPTPPPQDNIDEDVPF